MRYSEIIGEAPKGRAVWAATERKHRAQAAYQAALQFNRKSVAPDRRAARDQKAKAKFQSAMAGADDALRSALRVD